MVLLATSILCWKVVPWEAQADVANLLDRRHWTVRANRRVVQCRQSAAGGVAEENNKLG